MPARSTRLALLACSMLGCAPQDRLTPAHADAIRDSVASLLADVQRHSETSQWDSLAALYSAGASFRFFEDGVLRYPSAASVRAALDGVPAGTRIRTTYRDMHIEPLAPGLASVGALFSTTFADDSGEGFGFAGAITLVARHEGDGWRIASGHSSTPGASAR